MARSGLIPPELNGGSRNSREGPEAPPSIMPLWGIINPPTTWQSWVDNAPHSPGPEGPGLCGSGLAGRPPGLRRAPPYLVAWAAKAAQCSSPRRPEGRLPSHLGSYPKMWFFDGFGRFAAKSGFKSSLKPAFGRLFSKNGAFCSFRALRARNGLHSRRDFRL